MAADFTAGLNENDPSARLVSIQRLGELGLPSSRSTLRRFIGKGNDVESKWALYAALRTGDVTALPRVNRLLAAGDEELPEYGMAFELRYVHDPAALADLLTILETAPGDLTRSGVMIALGENLKDRRAVPALAAHLSDPNGGSYRALEGIGNITHEPACTPPEDGNNREYDTRLTQCRIWWAETGQHENWSKQ
ncbi:MAG TPA: hypothetical protein VEJ46_10925 [Candidatus Acidoferrum sp.]|nr:hypothetical protein [Candidatus Acidoferrum sp.]